jgi:hypothetical protein
MLTTTSDAGDSEILVGRCAPQQSPILMKLNLKSSAYCAAQHIIFRHFLKSFLVGIFSTRNPSFHRETARPNRSLPARARLISLRF